ncbi:MAG: DNA polymerase III subunit delta [Rhodospirillales bacterium]|nr:DNA polymerase III subunit delta [Rhodospirillales bacterium]
MQIKSAAVEEFIARPDSRACAILLYGPDQGLVRERADRLAAGVVPDLKDPFRVAELTAASLKGGAAPLRDEAAAIAFGGGRRVVRIRDAGDGLAAVFKDFLSAPAGDALILVEAGDLPKRSSLRALFDTATNAAALPCYRDEGRGLEQVIRAQLRDSRFAVETEALTWLAGVLGGDRGVTRGELEKLALYMADRGPDARISLADAQAAVGDSAASAVDDVLEAAAQGDLAALDRAIVRAAGLTTPVGLLRAAQRHFQRLHLASSEIALGATVDAALRAIRPPLFFRAAERFKTALRLWNPARIERVLERLLEAELAAKRTGAPDAVLVEQVLLEIALCARAETGRRR